MILFIAENFSERQHLASVRSCFHPVQQLDGTQQHKAMNQFARVTQRVNASFQIRPQESLTPCVPKLSHIRDRVQQLLLTPMDFSVTFFCLCLGFQSSKESYFLTFFPVGRSDIKLVFSECQNSLSPSTKIYSSRLSMLMAGKVRKDDTIFHSHWKEDGNPEAS